MMTEGSDSGEDEGRAYCSTVLLDDDPAQDVPDGPHRRVARAIAEIVQNERGSRAICAIGLEGAWGSGKSTIVNMLRDDLLKRSDFRVLCFDAWSHQGDPLRRSFLEAMISRLLQKNAGKKAWLKKSESRKVISQLTERRTRTVLSPWGWLFAALLLVGAVGIGLLGVSWSKETIVAGQHPKEPLLWSLGMALSPVALLVVALAWFGVRRLAAWICSYCQSSDGTAAASASAPWLSTLMPNTTGDTIQTGEPTSIEFSRYFNELLKAALSGNERRLLVVFDNLDRVAQETARTIWSTLQTFLQPQDLTAAEYFQRVWFLVPYDRDKLMDPRNGGGSTDKEGFIDKTFVVQFTVPPPVLSHWREYFIAQLKVAMPEHPVSDWNAVYPVFDTCRSTAGSEPTFREIKLFINRLGAIHRQWRHEFPLHHAAYFVLRRSDDLPVKLRDGTWNKKFPTLLDRSAARSLAGLWFNVSTGTGMELLLDRPMRRSLREGRGATLHSLRRDYRADFDPLLDRILTGFADPGHEVFAAAIALTGARILVGPGDQAVRARRWLEHGAMKLAPWGPDDDPLNGAIALLRACADQDARQQVLVQLRAGFEGSWPRLIPDTWVEGLVGLFRCARDLGLALPNLSLHAQNPEPWMTFCRVLVCKDPGGEYWGHFTPLDIRTSDLPAYAENMKASGKGSEALLATLLVMRWTKGLSESDCADMVNTTLTPEARPPRQRARVAPSLGVGVVGNGAD